MSFSLTSNYVSSYKARGLITSVGIWHTRAVVRRIEMTETASGGSRVFGEVAAYLIF